MIRTEGGDGAPLVPTVSSITAAALGLSMMVIGHEERVRKARAAITHTHSEKPLTKRQRRRQRALKATLPQGDAT